MELENKIKEMKEKLVTHEKEEEYHLAKEKNMETEMEEYRKIIEKLQREVEELKSKSEILNKEQVNKLVHLRAQVKHKDWEIGTYQKKLHQMFVQEIEVA